MRHKSEEESRFRLCCLTYGYVFVLVNCCVIYRFHSKDTTWYLLARCPCSQPVQLRTTFSFSWLWTSPRNYITATAAPWYECVVCDQVCVGVITSECSIHGTFVLVAACMCVFAFLRKISHWWNVWCHGCTSTWRQGFAFSSSTCSRQKSRVEALHKLCMMYRCNTTNKSSFLSLHVSVVIILVILLLSKHESKQITEAREYPHVHWMWKLGVSGWVTKSTSTRFPHSCHGILTWSHH